MKLTAQQKRIVTRSFDLHPVRHGERDDVHQLAWKYLICRRNVDWDDPKALRSASRNCVKDASIQLAKVWARNSWLTVNSLELDRLDPPAPDVLRIDVADWNRYGRTIATVNAIPQPSEPFPRFAFDRPAIVTHVALGPVCLRRESSIVEPVPAMESSFSSMFLRVKAVKMARRFRRQYSPEHYARIRRQTVRLSLETGSTNVTKRAVRLARIAQVRQQAIEKRIEAEKQANRASFRLNRMLRELLSE